MDKRIVYTRPDGGVTIVQPAPNARMIWFERVVPPPADVLLKNKVRKAAEPTIERRAQPAFTQPEFRIMENLFAAIEAGSIEFAESEEEFRARIMKRSVPAEAVNVRSVDLGDIPTDREFREAWTDEYATPTIDVHMGKAREIVRENLRRERAPLLASLDAEYQKADETEDVKAKKAIAGQKQRLRDLPADPRIEAATSPERLKSLMADIRLEVAAALLLIPTTIGISVAHKIQQ